jgi:hypothetical protein
MSVLLTIDDRKLRESLNTAVKPGYVVTVSNLTTTKLPDPPAASLAVGGTTMFGPAHTMSEARENILALRRKIEASGTPLMSISELDAEIDDIKGHNRGR